MSRTWDVRLLFRTAAAIILCGSSWRAVPCDAQRRPSTDVFLAPLSIQNGRPVIGKPVNITDHPGYDGGPAFTPDGRAVLFARVEDGRQANIYRYDIASKTTTRLTSTAANESSPTMMPGGTRFSVIRSEQEVVRIGRRRMVPDSTHRLWTFALDGSDGKPLPTAAESVGYHAWMDANNLALVMRGDPNALVHADLRTGRVDTLVRDIGRVLAPLPDHSGVSFTRLGDTSIVLSTVRWPSRAIHDLVSLPQGAPYVAWASNDVALAPLNSRVLYWHSGAPAWAEAGDFSDSGLFGIGQLALSPDGKWLALTAYPTVCPIGATYFFDAIAHGPGGFEMTKTFHLPSTVCFRDGQ